MKVAIYPGSFNPFHEGHADVLWKATEVFDYIYVAIGINPEKSNNGDAAQIKIQLKKTFGRNFCPDDEHDSGVLNGVAFEINKYEGLLKDHINSYTTKPNLIIKGLRDPNDFLYEQKMQYHNEDLGINIPVFYCIADRKLVHVSSSAIRSINQFKKG